MRIQQYFRPVTMACVLGWFMAAPLPTAAQTEQNKAEFAPLPAAVETPAEPNKVKAEASAAQNTGEEVLAIAKPQAGAAVLVTLGQEKNYLLDLSALAGQQVTLVHLPDRLLIMFDNASAVTITPFAGTQNLPPPNVKFKTGGRILTGMEFLPAFSRTAGKARPDGSSKPSPAQVN